MSVLLRCEISGETASTTTDNAANNDIMVVTPSGHICKKRLLLAKLSENGGFDPFSITTSNNNGSDNNDRRLLSEDDLIELKIPSSSSNVQSAPSVVPLRNNNITSTLQQLQNEYDSIILELFDTRQQLQITKQELTNALYQNDAAIRVIARLATERDEARNLLLSLNNTNSNRQPTTTTVPPPPMINGNEQEEEPATKRARVENEEEVSTTNSSVMLIPQLDLDRMLKTWEKLHASRKSRQKVASKQAVKSVDIVVTNNSTSKRLVQEIFPSSSSNNNNADVGAHHRLLAVNNNNDNNILVAAMTNDTVILISSSSQEENPTNIPIKLPSSILGDNGISMIACVDTIGSMNNKASNVIVGCTNGFIVIYNNNSNENMESIGQTQVSGLKNNKIVDIRFHPDNIHFVAAIEQGVVVIGKIDISPNNTNNNTENLVEIIASFQQSNITSTNATSTYTAGTLHPDGLIYLVGTITGEVQIWDFKSQTCAGSLNHNNNDSNNNSNGHDNNNDDQSSASVKYVTVSNNGYHVAVVYANNHVVVWDLRKLSIITTLNVNEEVQSLTCVQFDPSGKYLAYSGITDDNTNTTKTKQIVISVTTVKEWDKTALIQVPSSSVPSDNHLIPIGFEWNTNNKLSLLWEREEGEQKQRNLVVFGSE